jgi:hypothetical protein
VGTISDISLSENKILLVTLIMGEMNHSLRTSTLLQDLENIFGDNDEVNNVIIGSYKIYNQYFDRPMSYNEFFKAYWPTIYGVYVKGVNVENYAINLFTNTIHVLEKIQDGLMNADNNTLEFSVINLFIPFIFSDIILNGAEAVRIRTHTKVSDAFSESLLYEWLNKQHTVYDDLITRLYISLLRRPMEAINGLACVSSCLRCVRIALMGTLS